jgi:transcriptional regulator with XRE-family HTH domain
MHNGGNKIWLHPIDRGGKRVVANGKKSATHAHLRAWRQYRGLTQAAVASRLAVKPSTISRWERGVLAPRMDDLERLAETFRASVPALMAPPQQPDFLATLEHVQRIIGRMDADSLSHWLAVGEAMTRGGR